MNWTINWLRWAPSALRTPTSVALRVARAVSRLTKLMPASSRMTVPVAATA